MYCGLTEETTEGHTSQLLKKRIHKLYKFHSFNYTSILLFLKKVSEFSWKTSFGLIGALGFLVPGHMWSIMRWIRKKEVWIQSGAG